MEFLSEVQEVVEDTAWMALKYLDNEEYLTLYIVGQFSYDLYTLGLLELGEKYKAFFCNFVNIKSIGEKICVLFTKLGKNMHFPQHDILPYSQKNIHP